MGSGDGTRGAEFWEVDDGGDGGLDGGDGGRLEIGE